LEPGLGLRADVLQDEDLRGDGVHALVASQQDIDLSIGVEIRHGRVPDGAAGEDGLSVLVAHRGGLGEQGGWV